MIEITDAEIEDLRRRLRQTRWPDAETVADWSQGVPLAYQRELVEYWEREYDMRRLPRRLNRFPNFKTDVDGLGIHYIHVQSAKADARPVIMTHGWPGSVVEFLEVIEPLSQDFHLVVPSLPGYGWSDKPTAAGTDIERIGRLWDALMHQLGYHRYYAQGGDWGALVTCAMSQQQPEGLAGVHVNLLRCDRAVLEQLEDRTAAEQQQLDKLDRFRDHGSGYAQQQATRPQTLGYGLADSPAGQLAWVIEKFHGWTDNRGWPEDAISRDALLDNVMVYWLTNTAASSARLYWENQVRSFGPIPGPLAYSRFPQEIVTASERFLKTRVENLTYYGEPAAGGHIAAFEQPELFVEEFKAGIGSLPD
jgi:pimeloyl-ACP methyl ester carboxylesterase